MPELILCKILAVFHVRDSYCDAYFLQIIYFGDNLWADAWPSKTVCGWDSVLILEEMDAEGYAVSDGTVPGHGVVRGDRRKLSKRKRKYEVCV